MKFNIYILMLITVCACKNQFHDNTIKQSKEFKKINYENEVYKLLNDAYRYNPKSPIKTDHAFIYQQNTLNESEKFVQSELFQRLLNTANCVPHYLSKEQIEQQEVWINDFKSFSKGFNQKFVTNNRLQFVSNDYKVADENRFITEVSAILFNENKAIMIINYKGVIFSARLYVKENGFYKGKCSVSDPPSAAE